MTMITLEVPDSLASQLTPLRDRLPDILQQTVGAWSLNSSPSKIVKTFPVYEEMMDFLASGPTPEQIIAHQASRQLQTQLEALLDKNDKLTTWQGGKVTKDLANKNVTLSPLHLVTPSPCHLVSFSPHGRIRD